MFDAIVSKIQKVLRKDSHWITDSVVYHFLDISK